MKKMVLTKQNRKFTLIELIAVIIILAIIAVVAIPRYLDLKDDAAESAAEGVFGALQGAVSMKVAEVQLGKVSSWPGSVEAYLGTSGQLAGWTGVGTTTATDPTGTWEVSITVPTDTSTIPEVTLTEVTTTP